MKTKSLSRPKVNVITLGCSKNIYDSEILMGQLKANAFDVAHEKENGEGGIVIINTCGFIDNAKQESIDTILKYAREKKKELCWFLQHNKDKVQIRIFLQHCFYGEYQDTQE